MQTINFIASGMMGDFIHSLHACKHICEKTGHQANLYLVDGHDGDIWRYGLQKAYDDVKDTVCQQPFIHKFEIWEGYFPETLDGNVTINLNSWRLPVADTHARTGKYDTCWTELLAGHYGYPIPSDYKWLQAHPYLEKEVKDRIIIHRSYHRHNSYPFWDEIIPKLLNVTNHPLLFVTCNYGEWSAFKHNENHFIEPLVVPTITDMVNVISGCRMFIGNQSAPFAIASALDVPRIVEMEGDSAPFYMGEEKYSSNISWFLNPETKYFANNSIVKL